MDNSHNREQPSMPSSTSNIALPRATLYPPSSSSSSPASSRPPRFPLPAAASAALHDTDEDARPAKRQKTQACLRCRRRKQKCDNQKPCSNCVKADEHCYAAPSIPPKHSSHMDAPVAEVIAPEPQTGATDISVLEERLSRLEQVTRKVASRPDYGDSDSSQRHVAEPLRPYGAAPSPSSVGEVLSLSRSTPAVALLATFAASASDQSSPLARADAIYATQPPAELENGIDHATQEALFGIYDQKVQWRYPFIRLYQLRNRNKRPPGHCTMFFINMIFSVALLLENSSLSITSGLKQEELYRTAVTRHLSHVFNHPDHLLHVQAYLMLAMHAVYSSSTERIITITSAAMRYCVMAELHSAAAEPKPVDVAARIRIQMRRRVFWCAYKLDRTVGGIYHLPFAIPDSQITVKLYANVDDIELDERCSDTFLDDAPGVSRFTDVSAALQVLYCRQIQSEILNSTLHRGYSDHMEHNDRWRQRVLDKLDRWRSLWDRYSGVRSQFASNDWINMMYSYSLGMLYQPTKTSVLGSAGAWTVKACVQACLIFRKLQRDSVNTELWLGLVTQFKCGVALLYTFFATPPPARSTVYEHPDLPEAIRACSITLTLIAERWPESKCMRDTFDILAREIPLSENLSVRTPPAVKRIRQESKDALLSLLKQLKPLIIHRDTLRMIEEIATEEFPCHKAVPKDPIEHQRIRLDDNLASTSQQHTYDSSIQQRDFIEEFFQPLTPYGLHLDGIGVDEENLGDTSIEFPAYFDQLDYF